MTKKEHKEYEKFITENGYDNKQKLFKRSFRSG